MLSNSLHGPRLERLSLKKLETDIEDMHSAPPCISKGPVSTSARPIRSQEIWEYAKDVGHSAPENFATTLSI